MSVHVYAGAPGAFTLYEDDGETFDYEQGGFRTAVIRHERSRPGTRVEVAGAKGTYTGAPPRRRLQIVIHGVDQPARVKLDGVDLPAEDDGRGVCWTWDGALAVRCGAREASDAILVTT